MKSYEEDNGTTTTNNVHENIGIDDEQEQQRRDSRQPTNANGNKKKRSKRTKNILYSNVDEKLTSSYQQVNVGDGDDIQGVFTAYFELINVYKGASTLAKWNSNSFK